MEKELQKFIEVCENLKKSKLVLIDKNISEIVKSINSSKLIYNFIVEYSINFNFDSALSKAIKDEKFEFPSKPSAFIVFIYNLFMKFDEKKINVIEFLNKYFSTNVDGISAYEYFCLNVVDRFEKIIVKALAPDSLNKEEKNKSYYVDILNRISFLAVKLKPVQKVRGFSVDEINIVKEALIKSAELENCLLTKSWIMILNKIKMKDKNFMEIRKEIINIASEL